jgi:hypothetical protein
MSLPAVNPAVPRSVSLRAPELANWPFLTSRVDRESPSFLRPSCRLRLRAVEAEISRQATDEYFVSLFVFLFISRLCSVTASGPLRRPAARRRSASAYHPITQQSRAGDPGIAPPFRSWFLPKGHPPRKHDLALGSRAHSLGFARCDPSKIGKFKKGVSPCIKTK